jgi:hypothetical protein
VRCCGSNLAHAARPPSRATRPRTRRKRRGGSEARGWHVSCRRTRRPSSFRRGGARLRRAFAPRRPGSTQGRGMNNPTRPRSIAAEGRRLNNCPFETTPGIAPRGTPPESAASGDSITHRPVLLQGESPQTTSAGPAWCIRRKASRLQPIRYLIFMRFAAVFGFSLENSHPPTVCIGAGGAARERRATSLRPVTAAEARRAAPSAPLLWPERRRGVSSSR